MKTFVLTGISRGLGAALHKLLSEDKHRDDQKIFISRMPIADKKDSSSSRYMEIDLSDKDLNISIDIASSSSHIIFINNAGAIEPISAGLTTRPADMEKLMQINCFAPVQLAQHICRSSKTTGARFLIFNISTGAANRPVSGWLPYCMSKAAAKSAFDVLAAENENVDVCHYDPGVMDTGMQEYIRSQSVDAMPEVESFRKLKADQTLKEPTQVANEILQIIEDYSS